MGLNVLITGSNSGFGLLMARHFAGSGHRVYGGYRNPARAGPLEDLRSCGLSVTPVELDVTVPSSIARAVSLAQSERPLDVLVNNAGYALRSSIEDISDRELHRQFDTNVFGAMRMIRAVLPSMRERGAGAIVNMSSIAGQIGVPYEGAYAASKHALEALTEALWYEVRPLGIRVHLIEPGAFATGFIDNIITASGFTTASPHWPRGEEFLSAALRFVADQGEQVPQEVAEAVLRAVLEPEPRLRHRVGRDADMLIPLYRGAEFEAFGDGILGTLALEHWKTAPGPLSPR